MIDLLFICDITGSMGGFIDDAKRRMKNILNQLTTEFNVDTKVGLSLYRDHPSQGDSFVTVTFDLMNIDEIQNKIDLITVGGGGDTPEAVLDGIIEGVNSMSWREGSRRIAFLIGDAPPHGMDGSECCTCGKTWGDAIQVTEEKNVPIYSIPLTHDSDTESSFKTLATFSGGLMIQADNALDAVIKTLREEFDEINLGAQVLDMLSKDTTPEDICKMLNINREKLSELETKSMVC
jgi:von Willebrand factor type A domain.